MSASIKGESKESEHRQIFSVGDDQQISGRPTSEKKVVEWLP